MGKVLTDAQVRQYHEQGYVYPVTAFSGDEARARRRQLEEGEKAHGLAPDQRRKMYLYLKWVDDVLRHPRILDAVEDVIGPDILAFHMTLWIKEAQTDAFISWHQDSTYFGLDPAEHVTAWVALSPSTMESGCVQVVPGSHKLGQVRHGQELGTSNMFVTGQTIHVPESTTLDYMVLQPGEFSLHHTYAFHNSMPNRSDDRRIGLGLSYIPTRCKCSSRTRLTASLVRGEDRYGHFELDPRPVADYDPAGIEVHRRAMQRWKEAREELIPAAHAQAA